MIDTLVNKIEDDKVDSFWYKNYSQLFIAKKNDRTFMVEPHGEIRVYFVEDGEMFKNEMAVKEAEALGLNDSDLNKLSEHDGWVNNNWFAIIEIDKDGVVAGDDFGIAHDYDEALELFKEVLKGI